MKKMYQAIRTHHFEQFRGLRPWQKHSQVVGVAGLVYLSYGVTLMLIDPVPARLVGLKLALSWMPLKYWGIIWVLVGILALASTRWPPASETWGYSTMAGLAALWSLFYLFSMLFLHAPINGIAGALVWGLMAFLWWGIAGLRNPEDIVQLDVPQEGDDEVT